MCTPVHRLSVCLIAEKPESPCTGVHIFTFAHKSSPILLLYQSRPVSIFQLKQASRADCQGLGLVLRGECALHWIALNLPSEFETSPGESAGSGSMVTKNVG